MQERITQISCDGCSEAGENAFGTAKEVREFLASCGWVNYGALDYCPQCKKHSRAKARELFLYGELFNR